jgi:hypothetical protein
VGRIVDVSNFFYFKHYIIFKSRSYNIRNVGFLKNDLELFNANGIIYFTDLAKERIIKSGEEVKIYHFKLKKTRQLFERGNLLIEIREEKKPFEEPVFHVEADDAVDGLLILLFLHYATKDFSSIGGD